MSNDQKLNKETVKQALKEVIESEITKLDLNLGRWVRRTFLAAILCALVYFIFMHKGFKFPWE